MQIDWGDLGSGAGTGSEEVNFGISVEDGEGWGISLESGTEVRALNIYYRYFQTPHNIELKGSSNPL